MLYKEKDSETLSEELFQHPTNAYRGTPFWAWNCKLEREELLRQIGVLHQMGFGGFHMHVRYGMETPYLSPEFMDLVVSCTKEAERQGMLAWLYDEDRWPSGFAGGFVTRHARFRQQFLRFSPRPLPTHEIQNDDDPVPMRRLLGRYAVTLDTHGQLVRYTMNPESVFDTDWYAYHETVPKTPRYNGQTYVDVLSPEAMRCFIDLTYEAYLHAVGDRFGGTVPAIFTDEPQTHAQSALSTPVSRQDVVFPYTFDFEETFRNAYGEELLPHLPELVWDLPNHRASSIRYHYHDHVCERFVSAYSDQCGAWCDRHGLAFTGHAMAEANLTNQSSMNGGEVMRFYRGFQIPGIDMLCNRHEFTTAKQCQSVVRQYGREGMMSELYGVTTWDFDFRGHKLHGDWQAACGVTVRVPHLSWVSMKGQSKRDYPASIHDHSPWFAQYAYIEDHFARVNTAMTRGIPMVRVGVIHPIESYWLITGPLSQDGLRQETMNRQFSDLTDWLVKGSIDFDFLSESLLPALCPVSSNPLRVGKMAYDVIVVPGCTTLRKSTLERLSAFRAAGGTLFFLGKIPTLTDAHPDTSARLLTEAEENPARLLPYDRAALLEALSPFRDLEMRNSDGTLTENLTYQLRRDGSSLWLFVAHACDPVNKHISVSQSVTISLHGTYTAQLYDTLSGTVVPLPVVQSGGNTLLSRVLAMHDSLLIRFMPGKETIRAQQSPAVAETPLPVNFPAVPYKLAEPNVFLLDMAEYALDDDPFAPAEELLRVDTLLRKRLGWEPWGGGATQPWLIPEEPITRKIRLRFTINSEIDTPPLHLALEDASRATVRWNAQKIQPHIAGFYVDRAISTISVPGLKKGENILEITLPFGKRTATEWCYLLGDFGVRVTGRNKTVIPMPTVLAHDTITTQGLPFYSGKITYQYDIHTEKPGKVSLRVPQYNAALLEISVDGGNKQLLAFAPYRADLGYLPTGNHTVRITAAINRTNTFGPVHLADETYAYPGPDSWRTTGDAWSYEYHLHTEGILKEPLFCFYE